MVNSIFLHILFYTTPLSALSMARPLRKSNGKMHCVDGPRKYGTASLYQPDVTVTGPAVICRVGSSFSWPELLGTVVKDRGMSLSGFEYPSGSQYGAVLIRCILPFKSIPQTYVILLVWHVQLLLRRHYSLVKQEVRARIAWKKKHDNSGRG